MHKITVRLTDKELATLVWIIENEGYKYRSKRDIISESLGILKELFEEEGYSPLDDVESPSQYLKERGLSWKRKRKGRKEKPQSNILKVSGDSLDLVPFPASSSRIVRLARSKGRKSKNLERNTLG